jgi:LysM repeat protein
MVARNRARYLAPIALVATIAGTYIVVHAALNAKQSTHSQTTGAGAAPRRRSAKFYVVRPGDNLSSISARTGIPLTTLESLNGQADPNALQAGQRIRLRR